MLQFQTQQFPFRMGLAEGVDPHQVPPGTLTTAENVVWKQAGRIEKRQGNVALTTAILGGGSIAAAARLFTRGSELCLIDGANLYAYSPTLASWRNIDAVPPVALTWDALVDTNAGVANSDQALYNGTTLVTAWVQGSGSGSSAASSVFVQAVDLATGVAVIPAQRAFSGTANGVRVVVLGTNAFVVVRSSANINAIQVDLLANTVGASNTLRADANAKGYDACVVGSTLVICYENTSHALKLYSYTFASSSFTQATTGGITGETGSAFSSIAIDGTAGESLYVVYSRSSSDVRVRLAVADPSTLMQTVAPVDLEVDATGTAGTYTFYQNVSVRRLTSASCIACWSTGISTTQTGRASSVVVTSAGSVTANTARGTWGAQWISRPFLVNGLVYAMAADFTDGPTGFYTPPGTYLAQIETTSVGSLSAYVPHYFVGTVDILIGGMSFTGGLPTGISLSSTKALVSVPFQATAAPDSFSWRCGIRQVTVSTGTDLPFDYWRTTLSGREAYVSASALCAYDGRLCFDYGMHRCAPINVLASTGGSMDAGNYLYGIVPEYRSAAGVLHRGPTFELTAPIAVASTGEVTITVASIAVQTKADVANGGLVLAAQPMPVNLVLYRSTVGGSTLQRLTYEPTYNVVTDNPSNFGQSVVDTVADASINGLGTALASRPAIYTTGGILDDYPPPGNVTLFHHVDRLFVLAGDQKTWWYSKAFQDDLGVAPGFHPDFRITFDDVQTAGASMDDKAVFFSATGLSYMLGTGPAPNGLNSDFAQPIKIQTDVGCTNARSVVSTPDGIMFLSARGLYLLSRGLELSWIGRSVKDTLANFPNVTSAVLVAKYNQVRFTANNVGGTAGVTLVYDYVAQQWSTFRHTVGGVYGTAYADACMYGGEWTFATASGTVFQETTASNLDAASYWVPLAIETAWISAAPSASNPGGGSLSFHSVRSMAIHGTSNTDHDLTIQVGFNSVASYTQTATWLGTSAVTAVGSEEAEVIIGTQRKCATIRFKVTDATPTVGTVGTGKGPAFDMMGIEFGMKKGFQAGPATKRA